MGKRKVIAVLSIIAIVVAVGYRIYTSAKEKQKEESFVTSESCFIFEKGAITGYYFNLCGKDVVIPDMIKGSTVTSIGLSAFENMKLTSVKLPAFLSEIQAYAFNNNELTEIVIPEKVTSIGVSAFSNNKITTIINNAKKLTNSPKIFNNNNLDDNNAFIYQITDNVVDKTVLISYGGAKKDNIIIPKNVTDIGSGAFEDCNVKSINLTDNLISIADNAFINNSLKEITIPKSINYIGTNVFDYNISKIIIKNKDSVKDFEYYGEQQYDSEALVFEGKTEKSLKDEKED